MLIKHNTKKLEAAGIPCKIRNEHLNQIYGEQPFAEVWPELWVLRDSDYDRATPLLVSAA